MNTLNDYIERISLIVSKLHNVQITESSFEEELRNIFTESKKNFTEDVFINAYNSFSHNKEIMGMAAKMRIFDEYSTDFAKNLNSSTPSKRVVTREEKLKEIKM